MEKGTTGGFTDCQTFWATNEKIVDILEIRNIPGKRWGYFRDILETGS